MKLFFCHSREGGNPVIGIYSKKIQRCIYRATIIAIIGIMPHIINSAAQTLKTTQQFAGWLRTLKPGRTPTGPAIKPTVGKVPSIQPTKQIFNVSGRFVRPETLAGVSVQPKVTPSRPAPTPVKTILEPSMMPRTRKEIFRVERIEPEVAQQLPQAAPVSAVLGIINYAASDQGSSRVQEFEDQAIDTVQDIQRLEKEHVPVALPDHAFVASIGQLQKMPDALLIGFEQQPTSRVELNEEVAIMPIYSGTVSPSFEQHVLNSNVAPTVHVEFNPKVTTQAPQGSLRISVGSGKDAVITDLVNFDYLQTMIPKNYLPTFNTIINSPVPVGMTLWHDPAQQLPTMAVAAPTTPLITTQPTQFEQPVRVQDEETLMPVPDLHALLAQNNLLGLLTYKLPTTLAEPPALPALQEPAKEVHAQPVIEEVKEALPVPQEQPAPVTKHRLPGLGYQRIINAYKAQLTLVKHIEQLGNTPKLLEQAEKTLIGIAVMLSNENSQEAMRMQRQSSVDRNELLSWVAAG